MIIYHPDNSCTINIQTTRVDYTYVFFFFFLQSCTSLVASKISCCANFGSARARVRRNNTPGHKSNTTVAQRSHISPERPAALRHADCLLGSTPQRLYVDTYLP